MSKRTVDVLAEIQRRIPELTRPQQAAVAKHALDALGMLGMDAYVLIADLDALTDEDTEL